MKKINKDMELTKTIPAKHACDIKYLISRAYNLLEWCDGTCDPGSAEYKDYRNAESYLEKAFESCKGDC